MVAAKEILIRLKRRMGKERALRVRWYENEKAKVQGANLADPRNYYEANIYTACMNMLDAELKKLKE